MSQKAIPIEKQMASKISARIANPDQSLLETLRQVKLNLDLAIAGEAGGGKSLQ